MVSGNIKWTIAILGSAVIHMVAVSIYNQEDQEILITGGTQIQVVAIGSSFESLRAMGNPEEKIDPMDAIEKTEPIEALDAEVIDSETSSIVALETTVELAEPVEVVKQPKSVIAGVAKPVEETMVAKTPQSRVADIPPVSGVTETKSTNNTETSISNDLIISQDPTDTLSSSADREIASLVPNEQNEALPSRVIDPIPEIENVPVPQKREAVKPRPQKQKSQSRTKKSDAKTQKNPQIKTSSGDGGKSKASNKQGTSAGRKDAKGKSSGNKTRVAKRAGNAAVTNYPGKIVRKLRRSIRYPKAAKRKKIRGEVLISFVVSKTGKVNGIRIVRGSGSSILDEAALKTVRRAAPFPKIPDDAGKSRWAFKVPLSFN